MRHTKLGFGIVGSTDIEVARRVAERAEALGLHSLWFNAATGEDALIRVAAAQEVTSRLVLGTGVIPVDRFNATEITSRIEQWNIDQARLIVGIGSAARPSPLTIVRENLEVLHSSLSASTVVGSLGPRMRKLGATHSGGILFNWLPPEFARHATEEMRAQAATVGNAPVVAATYVRTALGRDSWPRFESEAARYTSIPAYGSNFERLGITAIQSAVHGETPEDVRAGVAAFDGVVDHAIVRAITANETLDEYVALLEAVAPLA